MHDEENEGGTYHFGPGGRQFSTQFEQSKKYFVRKGNKPLHIVHNVEKPSVKKCKTAMEKFAGPLALHSASKDTWGVLS